MVSVLFEQGGELRRHAPDIGVSHGGKQREGEDMRPAYSACG